MYKKLDEADLERLLEAGIDEFAECGLDRAAISRIATKAGISVGVIYKYYEDKDAFFLACVQYSLRVLAEALEDVVSEGNDLRSCIENLVHTLIREASNHPAYYKLYNEITSGSCKKYAASLAKQIEETTADIYATMIQKAQKEGRMTCQGDPKLTAFFFDNLLMMLQFSFSCDYYRQRMRIFCGEESMENPERIGEAFITFIEKALGV